MPDRITRLKQLKQGIRDEIASVWKREAVTDCSVHAGHLLPLREECEGRRPEYGTPPVLEQSVGGHERWIASSTIVSMGQSDVRYRGSEKYLASEATALAARYRKEASERAAFNRENFEQVAMFDAKVPTGWTAAGNGVADGFSSAGDIIVEPEGDKALRNIVPRGLYTNLLSGRLNGALRSRRSAEG